MDAAGKLTIRHELKDSSTVKRFQGRSEMDQEARGGYGGEGRMWRREGWSRVVAVRPGGF